MSGRREVSYKKHASKQQVVKVYNAFRGRLCSTKSAHVEGRYALLESHHRKRDLWNTLQTDCLHVTQWSFLLLFLLLGMLVLSSSLLSLTLILYYCFYRYFFSRSYHSLTSQRPLFALIPPLHNHNWSGGGLGAHPICLYTRG